MDIVIKSKDIGVAHKLKTLCHKGIYITLLAVAGLAVSCNYKTEKENTSAITNAAQVLETDPQQALNLLQSVKTGLLNDADYAYYNLLKVRAWNMTGRDITSDTIVVKAKDYFIRHDDAAKAAFACFVLAKIYHTQGNAVKALYNYQLADDWAATADYNIPNLVYGTIPYNIASLQYRSKNYDESLSNVNKALEYIDKENGKYIYKLYALELKGIVLKNLDKAENALTCYDEALRIAQQNNDSLAQSRVFYNKCVLLYTTKDYTLAKKRSKELLIATPKTDSIVTGLLNMALARIYNATNKPDSALLSIGKAQALLVNTGYDIQIPLYDVLGAIAQKKGNTAQATTYRQHYEKLKTEQAEKQAAQQDALQNEKNQKRSSDIAYIIAQTDSNRQLVQQADKQLNIALVVLAVMVLIGLWYMRHYRRDMSRLNAVIYSCKDNYVKTKALGWNLNLLVERMKRYFEREVPPDMDEFDQLIKWMEKLIPEPQGVNVPPFFDIWYDRLFAMIRENLQWLKEDEYHFVCMYATRLYTIKEIAIEMGVDADTCNTMRNLMDSRLSKGGQSLDEIVDNFRKSCKLHPLLPKRPPLEKKPSKVKDDKIELILNRKAGVRSANHNKQAGETDENC